MAENLKKIRLQAAIAALAGGLIEFYDFAVYGYLAKYVAATFFPSTDPTASMLAALAVFGVGFLARPIGGILMGRLADTRGRKVSMIVSIAGMAAGTLVIGLLPGYATIGVLAPILLVAARLAQGLSIGGEWGAAVAFLVEWAPPRRRGFFSSFHSGVAVGGIAIGSGVAALTATFLSSDQMQGWGWRIPFLLTIVLGPLGYMLRSRAQESPEFRAATISAVRKPAPFALLLPRAVIGFLLTATYSLANYTFILYMPNFTTRYGGLAARDALWSNMIAAAIAVICIPLFGLLCDIVGRRRQLIWASLLLIIMPLPLLWLVQSKPGIIPVFLAQLVLDMVVVMMGAAFPVALAELFPVRLRGTWMSSTFALSVAIFGGFAPFFATWVIEATHAPIALAFYVAASGIPSAIAAAMIPLSVDEASADPRLSVECG